MQIFKDLEAEYERAASSIQKYGWTSDHNLDWFIDATEIDKKPAFIEFEENAGLLIHFNDNSYSIWSDPLCPRNQCADLISFFSKEILEKSKEIWCTDVSEGIRAKLLENGRFHIGEVYYSLFWPVLNMEKYNPELLGGNFKEIRNAKNKFYREHRVEVLAADGIEKSKLHKIVEDWKKELERRNETDIYDLKYHLAVENNFKGFKTARVLVVDGMPVGINAGYEVPNQPGRFAGIIGIHNYSASDLGSMLWLEDLDWVKNIGYIEFDMQGSEDDGGLKLKLRMGAVIERKTETFCIKIR